MELHEQIYLKAVPPNLTEVTPKSNSPNVNIKSRRNTLHATVIFSATHPEQCTSHRVTFFTPQDFIFCPIDLYNHDKRTRIAKLPSWNFLNTLPGIIVVSFTTLITFFFLFFSYLLFTFSGK